MCYCKRVRLQCLVPPCHYAEELDSVFLQVPGRRWLSTLTFLQIWIILLSMAVLGRTLPKHPHSAAVQWWWMLRDWSMLSRQWQIGESNMANVWLFIPRLRPLLDKWKLRWHPQGVQLARQQSWRAQEVNPGNYTKNWRRWVRSDFNLGMWVEKNEKKTRDCRIPENFENSPTQKKVKLWSNSKRYSKWYTFWASYCRHPYANRAATSFCRPPSYHKKHNGLTLGYWGLHERCGR